MTQEEIDQIKARMADSKEKWNVLHAQSDRAKLMAEVERLRKRLSTCKFCGQEVAEGLGGHTSSCYERALAERKVVESTPHGKDGQPFYDAYEAGKAAP